MIKYIYPNHSHIDMSESFFFCNIKLITFSFIHINSNSQNVNTQAEPVQIQQCIAACPLTPIKTKV